MHSQSKDLLENPDTVGGRLKYWRKVSRLRLVDVASLIHVSQGSLSDLENGQVLAFSRNADRTVSKDRYESLLAVDR